MESKRSWGEFFKDKHITVMGLGLLGRGVGDIAFLAKLGAILTVTDLKSEESLAPSLKKLAGLKNVHFVLGRHRKEDFKNADLILKAAGVPLESEYLKEALKHKVPVMMSSALFAEFSGATIVGITGTRGKSTVTHLIHHVLLQSKLPSGVSVHIGGNVRGISTLALLPKVRTGDIVVLELDSWQLQGFDSIKKSPHIAVFTSFSQDHLNYYPNMQRYFEDKAAIYRHQKKEDTLIAGPTVASLIKKDKKNVHGSLIEVSAEDIPKSWKRNLIGTHNEENIACAAAALRALNISPQDLKSGIASFKPVAGRLEHLRTYKGIAIYNDNNGTTPDATVAALRALPRTGDLILIMGGSDKGISFKPVVDTINARKARVVLLPGTGTERFKKEFIGKYIEVPNMDIAVVQSLKMASKGDTIVLSPACASFGLFKNEYDRNDQFVEAIEKLPT